MSANQLESLDQVKIVVGPAGFQSSLFLTKDGMCLSKLPIVGLQESPDPFSAASKRYVDTHIRQLRHTQGPQGFQGDSGAQGRHGPKAEDGPQGFQGKRGGKGEDGAQGDGFQGPQGLRGKKARGAQGLQGLIGPQGRSMHNLFHITFSTNQFVTSGDYLNASGSCASYARSTQVIPAPGMLTHMMVHPRDVTSLNADCKEIVFRVCSGDVTNPTFTGFEARFDPKEHVFVQRFGYVPVRGGDLVSVQFVAPPQVSGQPQTLSQGCTVVLTVALDD